jgi:hypothetical protein
MRQKENETIPDPLKPEELTELQKLLQTDNIAPVVGWPSGDRSLKSSYVFATSVSVGSVSKHSITDVPPISLAPVTI